MIVWIGKALALAIHDRQLAEHGGSSGVRDEALLESALARPQQLFAHGDPPPGACATEHRDDHLGPGAWRATGAWDHPSQLAPLGGTVRAGYRGGRAGAALRRI